MTRPAHVYRLELYGLTLAGLTRLGARKVRATVQLSGKTARALRALPPSERQRAIRETLVRQLKQLARAVPEATLAPRNRRKPWTIDATLPARSLPTLAAAPSVAYVFLNSIEGRVASREKPKLRWHCVWGVVAIQVEGHTSGMITLEDRLVAVQAYDPEDAKRRLAPMWRDCAEPYLNPVGELVRWQLVGIQDVYEGYDEAIEPRGTEIYSRLRRVRMKPEYRWSPPPKRAARGTTARRRSR
jgi:Domain of unknown function (DUF4288)